MKLPPSLLMLPVALGVGFLSGKQRNKEPEKSALTEQGTTREPCASTRSCRTEPFGGQSFSLSSMEDIHVLPASASRWAAALSNGSSRDAGLKAVAESWSQYAAVASAVAHTPASVCSMSLRISIRPARLFDELMMRGTAVRCWGMLARNA